MNGIGLIHIAQVEEFGLLTKPEVVSIEELAKEHYMETVADVTKKINNGEAEKVVIARSVKLNFADEVPAVTALHHISNEQQESYHFGLQKDGQLFFGATPERLIEIQMDGRIRHVSQVPLNGVNRQQKTVNSARNFLKTVKIGKSINMLSI